MLWCDSGNQETCVPWLSAFAGSLGDLQLLAYLSILPPPQQRGDNNSHLFCEARYQSSTPDNQGPHTMATIA